MAALHAPIGFHGSGPGSPPKCSRPKARFVSAANDSKLNSCPVWRSALTATLEEKLHHGSSCGSAEGSRIQSCFGKDDLQTLPLAEVEKKLGSSPDGLTQTEAQKRLTQYGPNEIAEKKANEILKFLSYFWGPIPWMIEAAVILSAAARHWPDFGIILLLLLANAMVGFWEEHQAGNAIAALKATLAIKARVKRDGKWVNPAARELVPGDAIRLRLGDIVPADARLLDGDEISVDQSALTGESMPATRKSGDAVFSGSIVRRGEIDALVYATGGKTYFGKTAELVETAVTVSHFQKAVLKIGNYLIILALILVAVIIGLESTAASRSSPCCNSRSC